MSNYKLANTTSQWFQDNFPGSTMNLTAENMVLVLHTTEGPSWPGYNGGATAPNYTGMPPLEKKSGYWRAHFPDEKSSRALENRSGGVQTNTQNSVQVELIGTCDPQHRRSWAGRGALIAGEDYVYWPEATDLQLKWLAKFVADMHERHGLKLVAPKFNAYPSSYGSNQGDRFTFAEWNKFAGICGHQHVPENSHGDPGNLNIEKLIKFTKEIVVPTTPTRPPTTPVPDNTGGVDSEESYHVTGVHWNIAGSDTVNGYAAENGVRGPWVGDHVEEIGYDVFLACEAGQKNLRDGISKVLGTPYAARAKAIWKKRYVREISENKVYGTSKWTFGREKKYGAAHFGSAYGKKYAFLEVHLDYRKPAAQAKQLQEIFKPFIKDCDLLKVPRTQIVVAGDFNPDLNGSADNPFDALADWGFEEKGHKTISTFLDGRHLDGILAHKNADVSVTRYSRTDGRGRRLSDHFPLRFILRLFK